jgi:hypothetical protein
LEEVWREDHQRSGRAEDKDMFKLGFIRLKILPVKKKRISFYYLYRMSIFSSLIEIMIINYITAINGLYKSFKSKFSKAVEVIVFWHMAPCKLVPSFWRTPFP